MARLPRRQKALSLFHRLILRVSGVAFIAACYRASGALAEGRIVECARTSDAERTLTSGGNVGALEQHASRNTALKVVAKEHSAAKPDVEQ